MQDIVAPAADRTRLWPDTLQSYCRSLTNEQWQRLSGHGYFPASAVVSQNHSPAFYALLSIFRKFIYISADALTATHSPEKLLAEHVSLLLQLSSIMPENNDWEQLKHFLKDAPDSIQQEGLTQYLLHCWIGPLADWFASEYGIVFHPSFTGD